MKEVGDTVKVFIYTDQRMEKGEEESTINEIDSI